MSARNKLIAEIKRQGLGSYTEPGPVVSLEQFFVGNNDPSSIGVNTSVEAPNVSFYEVLETIRERDDVQDVLVEIYELPADETDESRWPCAEKIHVLTRADFKTVESWVLLLEPSEIWEGWQPPGDSCGAPRAAPALRPGFKVYTVWWD